jgi:P-type Cu2+ transporter
MAGLLALCCPSFLSDQELPEKPVSAVHNAQPYVKQEDNGLVSLALMVENMTCAACLPDLDTLLKSLKGIEKLSINLTTRRLWILWDKAFLSTDEIMDCLAKKGYLVHPFDSALLDYQDKTGQKLLKSMGIAGFAATNIMLLSVSVWAGLAEDMDVSTRTLFYWISALMALPAVAWAGQPFFQGALSSLKAKRLSMDVPIALAVILSLIVSVIATLQEEKHAYFDAGVTLLFFLLIGRYLDHQMRAKARSVAENLLLLQSRPAIRVDSSGKMIFVKSDDLKEGDIILVRTGDRVMADGVITEGQASLDKSFLTGESVPVFVKEGDPIHAGTIALDAPLLIRIEKAGRQTLLAEIVDVMENAQQNRSHFMQISDRVSRWYAPVVHIVALLAFTGWLLKGASFMTALMIATAVLIITCPCALALAVPVVQVVATGRLMKSGIFVKGGDVLERLASIKHIYFDKTGTLTKGKLTLILQNHYTINTESLSLVAALSRGGRHPIAECLQEYAQKENITPVSLDKRKETHGLGQEGYYNGTLVRLGRASWVGVPQDILKHHAEKGHKTTCSWMKNHHGEFICFEFSDTLREDARATLKELHDQHYATTLLSGDEKTVAHAIGETLDITDIHGNLTPLEKVQIIEKAMQSGQSPLMIGDGLNDAPALLSAKASISLASASDLAQNAADIVFVGDRLNPIVQSLSIAKQAYRRMIENITLSLIYNVCAIPLAVLGYVTPLWASIAMSTSSVVVILNALRIHEKNKRKPH